MQVELLLKERFPEELVRHIVLSYKEVERNYKLSQWKVSELDAGHFVESVRRLLEHELLGAYTSFSDSLGSFSSAVLAKYENARGNESLRILIPRVLYGVYCIRNKRGVGHISEVSPNEMDATYILYAVKWVLAELVRLASDISPQDAERIVRETVERQVEAVWDDGETFMILSKNMKASDKALVALYRRDNIRDAEIQALIGYSNSGRFKVMLKDLKRNCLIDYLESGSCKISPLGVVYVEGLLALK